MMKFLALTSYLLATITMNLMSFFVITSCFEKVNFQVFNLVILNFELPSAFLYSRDPNNSWSWNNRGLNIEIIINNRGVRIIGGFDGVEKNSVHGFSALIC